MRKPSSAWPRRPKQFQVFSFKLGHGFHGFSWRVFDLTSMARMHRMKKKSCPSMFDFWCPVFNSFNLRPFVSIRGFSRLGTKKRDSFESLQICCWLGLGVGLFPGALGRLGDEALLDGLGGDADVLHLAIDDGLTRCRFGRKRRFTTLVMCMPMPPFFLALPLRRMRLPVTGPVPVS